MKKELLSKLKKKMPEETGMQEMELADMPGGGPQHEADEGVEEEPSEHGPGGYEEGMAEAEGEMEPSEGEEDMVETDLSQVSDEMLMDELKKRGLV